MTEKNQKYELLMRMRGDMRKGNDRKDRKDEAEKKVGMGGWFPFEEGEGVEKRRKEMKEGQKEVRNKSVKIIFLAYSNYRVTFVPLSTLHLHKIAVAFPIPKYSLPTTPSTTVSQLLI